MAAEITNIVVHPDIKENYRGFEILGFGKEWTEKEKNEKGNEVVSKHSLFNAIIYDFNNIEKFRLCDDDGEKIKSVKNGINTCKKSIERAINSALSARKRISEFDWEKYTKWYYETIKDNQKTYADYYKGGTLIDPEKIDYVALKEYVINLDKQELEFADRILNKVSKEDIIWVDYILPITWF